MGKPKKPTKILELSGAYKKDPSRAKSREREVVNDEPIGSCPSHLDGKHSDIWDEVVSNSVDGVLTASDRLAVEILVVGLHDFRFGIKNKDGDIVPQSGTDRDRVFKQLGKFGFNPSERANVMGREKEKPVNEFGSINE